MKVSKNYNLNGGFMYILKKNIDNIESGDYLAAIENALNDDHLPLYGNKTIAVNQLVNFIEDQDQHFLCNADIDENLLSLMYFKRTVVIKNSTIGHYAFYDAIMPGLILENVRFDGTGQFKGAETKTVEIINTPEISDECFNDCDALRTVIIGDGTTKIGRSAFKDCFRLQNVYLPNSLQEIGENAFRGINEDCIFYCLKSNRVIINKLEAYGFTVQEV